MLLCAEIQIVVVTAHLKNITSNTKNSVVLIYGPYVILSFMENTMFN